MQSQRDSNPVLGIIHSLTATQKWFLLVLGLCLAMASAIAQVILFTSYANSGIDTALAGLIALALVGCQFVFVSVAISLAKAKHYFMAVCLGLVLVVLLWVSVSGSASFFESRFNGQQQASLKTTDAYQVQRLLMDDYRQQASALRVAATAANEKGNAAASGYLLRQAKGATKLAQQAASELLTMKPQEKSSGEELASLAGDNRWLLWYTLAALVDVCALLCFAVLGVDRKNVLSSGVLKKGVETETETETQTQTQTQTTAKPRKAIDPEKIVLIKQQIKNGHFGKKPGVRAVMKEHHITSHKVVSSIYQDLEADNVVKRAANLRTYELVVAA